MRRVLWQGVKRAQDIRIADKEKAREVLLDLGVNMIQRR